MRGVDLLFLCTFVNSETKKLNRTLYCYIFVKHIYYLINHFLDLFWFLKGLGPTFFLFTICLCFVSYPSYS